MSRKMFACLVLVSFAAVCAVFSPVLYSAGGDLKEKSGEAVQAIQSGVEISTEQLKEILASGKGRVIDVRPPKEYAISHIPGSTNVFENDIEAMMRLCPDKAAPVVFYCNGPHCHKTVRVAEKLVKNGYTNIKKYHLGLPVWRAVGNTAETDLGGFKHVYGADKTAVFIDARSPEEYKAGTAPGSVNMKPGEAEAANRDGRLPYTDHGTRIIVFGSGPDQARRLAEEIAQRAYWNSGYFSGTYEDLKKAGLW